MTMRRNFLALLLICGLPVAAAAQTPAVILACTFTNEQPGFSKFENSKLYHWNAQSWAWVERSCVLYMYNFTEAKPPTCVVTISEQAYTWNKQWGYTDPGLGSSHMDVEVFTVDRMSGQPTYSRRVYNSFPNIRREETPVDVVLGGVCEKASDPALQPKPGPKF